MNTRHYIFRLLLVSVVLFVLFSHSPTVYASNSSTFMGEDVSLSYNNGIATLSHELESNPSYSYSVYCVDGDNRTEIIPYWHEDEVGGEYNNIGAYNYLYIIELPESVSKNTTFDFNLSFYRRGAHAITGVYALDGSDRKFNLNYDEVLLNYMEWNTMSVNFSNAVCNDSSVAKICIHFRYTNVSGATELFATNLLSADLVKVSEESLMGNIIQIIQNIWNSITELPTKIVDGIKNLFIPSKEDITNMKDKWDTLLADRFGALYQVVELIHDYATAFKEQNKTSITFPSINISLAGSDFTFGGWEVQVVPDGFGIVFDTLKIITSILATLLFANGLKNRFEKLLGGSDNI